MRDTKFRALCDDDSCHYLGVNKGDWVYGWLCDGFILQGKNPFEIDTETVGQYTGLKDKNGKEIYEGDVVHAWLADEKGMVSNYLGKVIFNDFEWSIETNDDFWPVASWKCVERCKVIGNIYENPELLEGNQ